MGHAGAIISGGSGTAVDKIKALNSAGVPVAGSPTELPELLKEQIKKMKATLVAKSAARSSAVKKQAPARAASGRSKK